MKKDTGRKKGDKEALKWMEEARSGVSCVSNTYNKLHWVELMFYRCL